MNAKYSVSIHQNNANRHLVGGRTFTSVLSAFEFAHAEALRLGCLAYVLDEEWEVVDRVDWRG